MRHRWDAKTLKKAMDIIARSTTVEQADELVRELVGKQSVTAGAAVCAARRAGIKQPGLGSKASAPGRSVAPQDIKQLRAAKRIIDSASKSKPKAWRRKKRAGNARHGVPTLFLSDLHHGEVVDPAEVNGANDFNMEISGRRIRRVVENSIYLLDSVFRGGDYPWAVMAMGGDMVSGNIHEELRETNDACIFDVVLDLTELLSSAIETYAERFGRVYVPCVVGNHGRLDRKPRAKRAPKDNYEYMLYASLAHRFRNDDRVDIEVSDSLTLTYSVFGTRYMLTHGDCFRGGGGIAGPFTPWALGDHRLRKQMAGITQWTGVDAGHDVTIFGHWHTYFPHRTFVANGSLKGFDEYSKRMGFAFEPPQQALWLTNEEYGMTIHMPVFGEDPPARKK